MNGKILALQTCPECLAPNVQLPHYFAPNYIKYSKFCKGWEGYKIRTYIRFDTLKLFLTPTEDNSDPVTGW